jgi:cell division protein FtsB
VEETNKKGPNDLEEQIDMLTKQKEYLQKKCREAGEAIIKQEGRYVSLEKEYDKVCEERDNFQTMLGNSDDIR